MLHDDSIGRLVTLKREPFNSIKELFLFFFLQIYQIHLPNNCRARKDIRQSYILSLLLIRYDYFLRLYLRLGHQIGINAVDNCLIMVYKTNFVEQGYS